MTMLELPPELLDLVRGARRATLATIRPDGGPRLVPVCFVVGASAPAYAAGIADDRLVLWSPLDEKPKRAGDPRQLARVRDILERPRVEVLVDRWDEDWRGLAWVRLDGTAALLEPAVLGRPREPAGATGEHARAVEALRAKYLQYQSQRLEDRPILRVEVERVASWVPSPPTA
jgi:PPOX class probable F420-dependent enzyme